MAENIKEIIKLNKYNTKILLLKRLWFFWGGKNSGKPTERSHFLFRNTRARFQSQVRSWVSSDVETCVLSGENKLSWLTPVMGISIRLSPNAIFFSFWISSCVENFFMNTSVSSAHFISVPCKPDRHFCSRDGTFEIIGRGRSFENLNCWNSDAG